MCCEWFQWLLPLEKHGDGHDPNYLSGGNLFGICLSFGRGFHLLRALLQETPERHDQKTAPRAEIPGPRYFYSTP